MSKEKRRVPKLRFPGFTEDWEQRKADYIFKSVTDKGYPELPVLSASQELGMVYREQNGIDIQHNKKNEASYKRVLPGQFVIHLRSFQGGFAYSEVEGITSPAYTVMSFKNSNEQYGLFWKHIFKSEIFIKRLETITYGIRDGRSISFSDFKSLILQYPSFSEQKMIGDSIAIIERGITLHQRKLEHLNLKKKALLQKLFPKNGERYPELRFPGFTDAWEQRKLEDVCNVYDGTHQTPRYTNSGVMFVSVENIETLESNKYITEEDFKSEFKVFPEYGDILLTRIGDVGSANVILDEIKRAYYVSLALLKPKDINSLFLLALLSSSSVQSEIWRRTLHIAFPKKINKNEINKVIVNQPSIPEQKKIGKLFFSLDQTITLHQRKLEHLQLQKKALLQQMFV